MAEGSLEEALGKGFQEAIEEAIEEAPEAGPEMKAEKMHEEAPETEVRQSIGLVIIGDEVLAGKVEEENAKFFLKAFRELGLRVKELAFVEDDVTAISEAVKRMAARYDLLLTTGGVGPTHDDLTLLGIADAFQLEMTQNEELLSWAKAIFKDLPAGERFSRVPEKTKLIRTPGLPWPLFQIQNVWAFPGVPWMVKLLFSGLKPHLEKQAPFVSRELELVAQEVSVCEALDALVLRHPALQIGSYPRYEGGEWLLRLTFDGSDKDLVERGYDEARALFSTYLNPELS